MMIILGDCILPESKKEEKIMSRISLKIFMNEFGEAIKLAEDNNLQEFYKVALEYETKPKEYV